VIQPLILFLSCALRRDPVSVGLSVIRFGEVVAGVASEILTLATAARKLLQDLFSTWRKKQSVTQKNEAEERQLLLFVSLSLPACLSVCLSVWLLLYKCVCVC
jgi:hypothetical protein